MRMKIRVSMAAAIVALASCSGRESDVLDPGVLAGSWGGPTQEGYRTVTFSRGAMTTDHARAEAITYPAEYHPEGDGPQAVRIELQMSDGKKGAVRFEILPLGAGIKDGHGRLEPKPDASSKP